jgi:hypothetical protein
MLGIGLLLAMNAGLVAAICYAFHRMNKKNNLNNYSPYVPSSSTSQSYGSSANLPSSASTPVIQTNQSQQDADRALLY